MGPFFNFQTGAGGDTSEIDILKSFLSPEPEHSSSNPHSHPPAPPLFSQTPQTGVQTYMPQAFPADRFEVVAESGSLFPVGVHAAQGGVSQGHPARVSLSPFSPHCTIPEQFLCTAQFLFLLRVG